MTLPQTTPSPLSECASTQHLRSADRKPLTLRQSHEEGMCTFQTKQLVQLGTQHVTSADRKPLALCQSHKDGMYTSLCQKKNLDFGFRLWRDFLTCQNKALRKFSNL